jgi:hypothetical protein
MTGIYELESLNQSMYTCDVAHMRAYTIRPVFYFRVIVYWVRSMFEYYIQWKSYAVMQVHIDTSACRSGYMLNIKLDDKKIVYYNNSQECRNPHSGL